ncbi:hypothetical protein ACHAWO_012293 [Cyclotella atomus]|uniref:Fucolectin tachylectin-4 pentraxin-1 domain-containing protein n=1 Tax=Cyclotella atomus TaxID=382360 RepID=A0ABD3PKG0_9STRA
MHYLVCAHPSKKTIKRALQAASYKRYNELDGRDDRDYSHKCLLCFMTASDLAYVLWQFCNSYEDCVGDGRSRSAKRIRLSSTTGEVLQMFEFQVISSGANVAINKVATQSSTYNNQASYRPSKAIDGDSPTFCHTQSGDSNSTAYWEVLLDKSVTLMKSEFSTDIGVVTTTRSLGNTCRELLITETFSPSSTVSADKLRVRATTGEQLQMFEVQIYASGSNVAPQGSASQPFDYNSKFAAHKAIDSSNSTFSNTTDSNAWQEVQLNKAVEVEKLVILDHYCQGYADSPGCLCRLSNAMVTLFSNNLTVATR